MLSASKKKAIMETAQGDLFLVESFLRKYWKADFQVLKRVEREKVANELPSKGRKKAVGVLKIVDAQYAGKKSKKAAETTLFEEYLDALDAMNALDEVGIVAVLMRVLERNPQLYELFPIKNQVQEKAKIVISKPKSKPKEESNSQASIFDLL